MRVWLVLCIFLVGCTDNSTDSIGVATDPQAIESLYLQSCFSCHEHGRAGAPRRGDYVDWEKRIAKGNDVLVKHVKYGYRGMPPKGMCAQCNDEQLFLLITFLSTSPQQR